VVPNQHFARLADLPPDVGARLFTVGARISKAIADSSLRSDGFNLFLSDGECAGQEVPHVHLHVLPRFEQDGLLVDLGRVPDRAGSAELMATASTIMDCMRSET